MQIGETEEAENGKYQGNEQFTEPIREERVVSILCFETGQEPRGNHQYIREIQK